MAKAREEFRAAKESAQRAKLQYRRELQAQMQADKLSRSKSREKEIALERSSPGISFVGYRKKPREERVCQEFNRRAAEGKKYRRTVERTVRNENDVAKLDFARKIGMDQYQQLTARKREEQTKVRQYYLEESARKDAQKRGTRLSKQSERAGLEQRLDQIQSELEAERRRTRANRAEILQILTAQMDAKKRAKAREREEEKKYRVWNETLAATPEKARDTKRCRICKSPIK